MRSYGRRFLGFFGAAPKQSRPTARRWPISHLDTISQVFGPVSRHFLRAGQSGPTAPKSRDSPKCDTASPSMGSKVILYLPILKAALAEAEASAGETDAGLRRLDDALAELECTEAHWYEAEMHRIRAEILLKRDPADTAAAEQS